MATTPKTDKYITLENELKDLERKIKGCRSDIKKAQKEKAQIEERLDTSLNLEETLSEELNTKRLEFSKMKAEKIYQKDIQKQTKEWDSEMDKLKQGYEKRLISKDKEIEKLKEKLSNKDKELDKINDTLQSKESLIKQTRDAHALAECPNSGIYLLRLDSSDKLKDKFKIPVNIISKNTIVYKYGRSNDVISRKEQHNQNLGKYIGKELDLIHSRLVSHYDCSSAETKVKKFLQEKDCYFISESVDGVKHKELVCINNKLLDEIKSFYNTL
jgi:DNA repair exonuclease SbcCD ATPase subunit